MIDTGFLASDRASMAGSPHHPELAPGMYDRAILRDASHAFGKLGLPTILGLSAWSLILSYL